MDESLTRESERLERSWLRHERAWLRDYLVAGVEDPRVNLQSIFSRHFLVRALTGEQFDALLTEECRFCAVMNWLLALAARSVEPEELRAVLYSLRRGADNAEGVEIPAFVSQAFSALPAAAVTLTVPNYVESFLSGAGRGRSRPVSEPSTEGPQGRGRSEPGPWSQGAHRPESDTFQELWRVALSPLPAPASRMSVLEPACGSANDYRFLHAYGMTRLFHYTGFDLCAANIENALGLFPDARFSLGNVFQIDSPDRSFDLCFVHDLFEHLSLAGMETAVREVCRVTRRGLCIGFFQMDEIREHVVRPVEDYYCNLLSMGRMRTLFAAQGFEAQVVHIASFLRQRFGCDQTHNPNAYTFILRRLGLCPRGTYSGTN
jgi:ubiquinone/menaquinone biosynthesis C-methylase UbiE